MANWTDKIIREVWDKATIVPPNAPDVWRKDQCGAWIGFSFYGNRDSEYGWEIDHITPVANGGDDDLDNLRPLQWQNNVEKSDGKLSCKITAAGTKNVEKK